MASTSLLLYSTFIAILLLTLLVSKRGGDKGISFNPTLILIVGYFLYGSANFAAVIAFNRVADEIDITYQYYTVVGALGYFFGAFLVSELLKIILKHFRVLVPRLSYRKLKVAKSDAGDQRVFAPLLVGAFFFMLFILRMSIEMDFQLSNLFSVYRFEVDNQTANPIVSLIGGPLALGGLLASIAIANHAPRYVRFMLLALLMVMAGVYILRGLRLYAMMCVLPYLVFSLRGRCIQISKLGLVIFFAYFIVQGVGYIRDIGFYQLNAKELKNVDMDPLGNEFGASFKVYTLSKEHGFFSERKYGSTYTIDALKISIPRFLWSERPEGLAIHLALVATGKTDIKDLTMAYGFSNLSEAIVNFGPWGIFPMFVLTYIFFHKLTIYLKYFKSYGVMANGLLANMAVFVNRMDTTMLIKVYISLLLALLAGFVINKFFSRLIELLSYRAPTLVKISVH
jgi:hypothetical protein